MLPHRLQRFRASRSSLLLLGAGILIALYAGSYVRSRFHHELIHTRCLDRGVRHDVVPGTPDGPMLFMAAALSGEVDRLETVAADFERRQRFLGVFYAPLRGAETLVWRVIDR